MTARIKELEAALSEAQSTVQSASRAPPPQVPEEPNREPDAEVHRLIEAVGSLAINDDGASKYHGSTSSSEVRLLLTLIISWIYLIFTVSI